MTRTSNGSSDANPLGEGQGLDELTRSRGMSEKPKLSGESALSVDTESSSPADAASQATMRPIRRGDTSYTRIPPDPVGDA